MSLTPLSELDAAFLAAETPTQPMHVVATLVLDTTGRELGYRDFQRHITERFSFVEALRRRLQPVPFADPVWVDDHEIRLANHLHHVHVDGGGIEALSRVVSDVASTPLTRNRPLWEAWLVEGFAPDRVGVIAKVHHCAVDGVSGFNALAAFFDIEPDPAEPLWTGSWTPAPPPQPREIAGLAASALLALPARVARASRHVLGSAAVLARQATAAPLPMTGPRLSFNRALSPRREVALAWVALDEVKGIRRAFGATVNDVVVSLATGVVRRYLDAGGELPDRALVAAVPTSERLPEHGDAGNRLSAMFYALPVHLADPAERVHAVQTSAAAAKDVYAAAGEGTAAAVAGMVLPGTVGPLMRAVSGLRLANVLPPVANVIVSNVRGPELPLYVLGARVEDIFPMGPLLEGTGLGVTVVSYRDRIGIGFLACPDLLPDVRALADLVPVELAALADAAASR